MKAAELKDLPKVPDVGSSAVAPVDGLIMLDKWYDNVGVRVSEAQSWEFIPD